jgi:transcriptional regulator GlxA family with amidase domain
MTRKRSVAVLLFDDVEVLDFAAPFEVFSVAGRRHDQDLFDVFTVAPSARIVNARNGLRILPRYATRDCPAVDVLVVPGGFGTREQIKCATTVEWVRRMAETSEVVLSVCTGALLLAAAGLLRGLPATTHRGAFTLLTGLEPQCTVVPQRVVDTGKVVSTAGVSAGLDGSLHIVGRLTTPGIAAECAEYIEYDWVALTEQS